jgi:hypothetical protein
MPSFDGGGRVARGQAEGFDQDETGIAHTPGGGRLHLRVVACDSGVVYATRGAGLPPFVEATRVPSGKEFGLAGLMARASPAFVARPWGTFA